MIIHKSCICLFFSTSFALYIWTTREHLGDTFLFLLLLIYLLCMSQTSQTFDSLETNQMLINLAKQMSWRTLFVSLLFYPSAKFSDKKDTKKNPQNICSIIYLLLSAGFITRYLFIDNQEYMTKEQYNMQKTHERRTPDMNIFNHFQSASSSDERHGSFPTAQTHCAASPQTHWVMSSGFLFWYSQLVFYSCFIYLRDLLVL